MNTSSNDRTGTAVRVQEHFQKAAGSFDDLYGRKEGWEGLLHRVFRPGLIRRARAAVEVVAGLDRPSVLDVGCGSGRVAEMLLDAGAGRYVGIDFSGPMIELAGRRLGRYAKQVTLREGDFLEAELDGPFDVVLGLGLFDYLDAPHRFTRRMFEVCSGTVVASFPRWTWSKGPIRKIRYEWINDCPIFDYTERELNLLFHATGFSRVEIDRFVRGGYLVKASR